MRWSIVKAFAISHAFCSLISALFLPPAQLKTWENLSLERLGFTEALEMLRYICYLPCIETRVDTTQASPSWQHRLCSTAMAPTSPLGHSCIKPTTQGGMGPTFPWRHCCIPCLPSQALPARLPFPTYPPDCLGPQDIYNNFLQECHVRKASKAFAVKMPCKQRGEFTPPRTPKLLWCWFFLMVTSHTLGTGQLVPAPIGLQSFNLILHNAEYSEPQLASRPSQGVPGRFACRRAPVSGMLSGKHCVERQLPQPFP